MPLLVYLPSRVDAGVGLDSRLSASHDLAMRVIVMLVAGSLLLASTACTAPSHTHPTESIARSSTPVATPDTLYSHRWVLSTIELASASRLVTGQAAAAYTFKFARFLEGPGGSAISDAQCDSATAKITASRIEFTHGFVNLAVAGGGCIDDSSVSDAHSVFGIMDGTDTWSVVSGKLSIRQPGEGTLVFTPSD